jgi:hypothetical protein
MSAASPLAGSVCFASWPAAKPSTTGLSLSCVQCSAKWTRWRCSCRGSYAHLVPAVSRGSGRHR